MRGHTKLAIYAISCKIQSGQFVALGGDTHRAFARTERKVARKLPKDKEIAAAQVAQMYFDRATPMNQEEIAERFGVEKSTVSRLLKVAKEKGLYDIQFQLPRENTLQMRLRNKFELFDAVVFPLVPPTGRSEHRRYRRILGESATKYLEADNGVIAPGQSVGISCGSTLRDTVAALTPGKFSNMSISQLSVEAEDELGLDASPLMLVGMLYAKWNGEFDSGTTASAIQPIPGTMWDGKKWSESYEKRRSRMLADAESLNVALVGIGHLGTDSDSGTFFNMLAKRGISESTFRRRNIVGEICNCPFDARGQDQTDNIPEIKQHVDGVNIGVLKNLVNRNRIVIAIAGGKAKANAIRVALDHKFINILITDTEAAEAICAE